MEGRLSDSSDQATEVISTPVLEVATLSKTYAGTPALNSLNLRIAPGETHALLGENGSGKSTLIKILSGFHRPDSGGRVRIDGRALTFGSSSDSHALGCRFVHQDLGLVDNLSIADNIGIGTNFASRFGTIRPGRTQRIVAEDLARVGLELDPQRLVGSLSPAERTGVAIARAMHSAGSPASRLIVFDEPTATLPDHEVERLLDMIRRVSATGVGLLYVTHRLDEVFAVAHNVTILRDGVAVVSAPVSDLTRASMIEKLLGRELSEVHANPVDPHRVERDPALMVTGLTSRDLRGISFRVDRGEVTGFAGLTGSGRDSVLPTVFGASPRSTGLVSVGGQPIRGSRPRVAMAAGMAYLPPNRKTQAAVMDHSARENFALADVTACWRAPLIRRKAETAEAQVWFDRLTVRPADAMERPLWTFSGGNQQKVLLAKWMRLKPGLLLLDEPSQGVDIGAKAEIHRQLLAAAHDGAAVIVSSSDVTELAAICHRVLVLRAGQVVADLTGEDVTVDNITRDSIGILNQAVRS